PALVQALERWEKLGTQSRLEKLLVLRANPEIINTLRQNKSVKRYLGENLGTDAIIIQNAGQELVFRALLESGYLLDVSLE
ncbi:MAG: hypothetical protein LWX83_16705, partial [Anaerolineae bacterium]|nr:hypothetical protein [Anaerolineae bacterium]